MARGPKPKPFECPEPVFWYLVGLIATDGCLVNNRRTVVVTSKEKSFLERLAECIGVRATIRQKRSGFGTIGYDLVIGRKILYDRLIAIGLTPRKSATLGPLRIPDGFFRDFLRGVIDGDGNIRRWIHPSNGRQQWTVRVSGCSEPFLRWLRETVQRLWYATGRLHKELPREENRLPRYILKFGKIAAKVVLEECYYSGALALPRKAHLAADCVATSVGWAKSKTVADPTRWHEWRYVHTWQSRIRRDAAEGDADPSAGLVREPAFTWYAGVSELADDTDLKSVARKGVWVRLPPPALFSEEVSERE